MIERNVAISSTTHSNEFTNDFQFPSRKEEEEDGRWRVVSLSWLSIHFRYIYECDQHAGHSGTRYIISPGGSSAGSGVTSGEPCSTPVEGTTSRRNYRRPRAWHPGPKWHSFARLVLTARKSKLTERVALPPAVRVRYAVARWWGMLAL